MDDENRQSIRYHEIGRVIAPEICTLPGILDNISATGCKVHFPVSATINLDNEYLLKISLSRAPEEGPLQLMCKPMWVSELSGSTQIGFSILFSPDEARLHTFIEFLQQINEDEFPDII